MKTRYSNPDSTVVQVTLEPGETLGTFTCPEDAASPMVFPISIDPPNQDGDALIALIKAGGAPDPDPFPTSGGGGTVPPISGNVASVSKAQGKLALRAAGLLDTVKQMVAASDDEDLKIWWEDAYTWERSSAYVATFAAKLGLPDNQVTDLFNMAGSLKT